VVALPLLDTNVVLRHLLNDHAQQSRRATAFLGLIELGETRVQSPITVVFETVFTLERGYSLTKSVVRDVVLPIFELPGIVMAGKRHLAAVFDIYVEHNVSFADAYHAVLARTLGNSEVISYDKGYDRVPELKRLEP
jgi:predicted nucleic acid-binding protein